MVVASAGLQRFTVSGSDGVELRIGDQLVCTRAPGSATGETAGGAALEPGRHRLRVTVVRTRANSTGPTFGWKSGQNNNPESIKAANLVTASANK